jgi:hypothetical protein
MDKIEKLLRQVADRERHQATDETAALRAELFDALADERRERSDRLDTAFAASE